VLLCEATAVHGGRHTQVWDAEVSSGGSGSRLALFRCTQMILWPKGRRTEETPMTDAPKKPAAPVDFYFDFSSPYGYFAAEKIDALAARHGRTVHWHPFLLGATFKVTGLGPLPGIPLKGAYSMHDIERSARFFGLPYRQPSTFPIPTQHAARAFLWLNDRSPKRRGPSGWRPTGRTSWMT
jgi:hypothetical protein